MRKLETGLFALALLFAGTGEAMEIVGHRGASHLAPENTLAAVKLAWELDADAVEIDVYLSKDRRIVAIHDRSTRRTAGVEHEVDQTESEALRKLDIGSWKNAKYQGEKIPFLKEILDTVPEGKRLLVEVKCGPEIVPVLAGVIEASGKMSQVVIISFHFEVATAAKQTLPRVPVFWLKKSEKDPVSGIYRSHDSGIVKKAKGAGLDGLGVHYGGVSVAFAGAVRHAGLKLYVWTVDSDDEARRLKSLGIDGLITNRPGWMRTRLGN